MLTMQWPLNFEMLSIELDVALHQPCVDQQRNAAGGLQPWARVGHRSWKVSGRWMLNYDASCVALAGENSCAADIGHVRFATL